MYYKAINIMEKFLGPHLPGVSIRAYEDDRSVPEHGEEVEDSRKVLMYQKLQCQSVFVEKSGIGKELDYLQIWDRLQLALRFSRENNV